MVNKSSDCFDSLCPVLAELLRTRRTTGKSGKKFNGIGALSSQNNLIVLRNLFCALEPTRTLEIGLCFGGSALLFAASHRETGRPAVGQHVALDPYQSSVWDDSGLLAIERAGLSEYLDFCPTPSGVELPRLCARQDVFNLVYIDGSHLFEDVFVDFYYVARLLALNGIVVFDDSPNPHVKKVLQFIRRTFPSAFSEMDLTPYRPEKRKSLKYRIAKSLGKAQMTAFRRIGPPTREWDARFANF